DFLDLFNPTNSYSYQPADPFGLILWDVNYGSKIQLIKDEKSMERMQKFFEEKEQRCASKAKLYRLLQHYDVS
ncbi:MAG: hypothetical protein ACFE96_08795, partial [Candidatus Hermodarchaeota archaeon]